MVYTGKATGDVAVEVELLSRNGGLQGKLTLCKCNFPPILEGVVIQIYKKNRTSWGKVGKRISRYDMAMINQVICLTLQCQRAYKVLDYIIITV